MGTVTLDQALDTIEQLSPEQKELLLEILNKRYIEDRRKEIAADARTSIAAYRSGQLQPQTADEMIADLRQSLPEDAE